MHLNKDIFLLPFPSYTSSLKPSEPQPLKPKTTPQAQRQLQAPRFLKPAAFFTFLPFYLFTFKRQLSSPQPFLPFYLFTFLPLKKLLPLKITFKCQSVLFGQHCSLFYKGKGQGFIVIAVCKGTKLNNVRQKTKHIYLCPRRFPCFLRPPLSQERGRMNNYFFIPKIRDLHYSLIPPCSSPSIFSVTFACRAN